MASIKIPYTKPSITQLEISYANDAVINGWGEKCYQYIEQFENQFKHYLGVKYAIATSSCTGALHMGMHALGIGPGDEVIMADTNWVATAAPIVHLGATPVFVDILPDTWCLDPDQVESAITTNTKAIVAVHLYGNLCDMNALIEISHKYNIPIIEDAAEAIGSVYLNQRAGSMGAFGAFSFHGTKTMTTGEGGLFVTNDLNLYNDVLTLSNHGRERNEVRQFWPKLAGYKFKMSNVQAAIGCAQLERIDILINRKREIFHEYKALLQHKSIVMNPEPSGCINGFWMPTFVCLDDNFMITDLIKLLHHHSIDARNFFWPLSSTSLCGRKAFDIPYISESIHYKAINLPSFHDMSSPDISYVSDVVLNYLSALK